MPNFAESNRSVWFSISQMEIIEIPKWSTNGRSCQRTLDLRPTCCALTSIRFCCTCFCAFVVWRLASHLVSSNGVVCNVIFQCWSTKEIRRESR
uniref:Uncharacterized protein n=1 Tax=Daphnia magna TaxID=35525 RepID=A0A0P5VEU4_9CRUS